MHEALNYGPDLGSGNASPPAANRQDGGRLLVLTAPLSEIIDHAGFFIQMAMASLPVWLEENWENWGR